MADYSADKPNVFLEANALGGQRIPVVSFAGHEGLNTLFRYDVVLRLAADAAEVADVLLSPAKLVIEAWTGSGVNVEERFVEGVVSSVSVSTDTADDGQWELTLVPTLWRLTQTRLTRIFQDMSVQDIVSAVLGEDGNVTFSFKLNGSRATSPREYCVQYQETNYDFVVRLLEEEGLFYSVEQGDQEMVVIRDGLTKLPDASPLAEVPWETAGASGTPHLEKVGGVEARGQAVPKNTVIRDFSYAAPGTELVHKEEVSAPGVGMWQEYRTVGFAKQPEAEEMTKILSERRAGGGYHLAVETTCRSITAGSLFKIKQVQVRPELPFGLDGKSVAALQVSCGFSHGDFAAQVTARPADMPWRPPRTRLKPEIAGPQTAFVVGAGGAEVMSEEAGRVKVQFHWDRDFAGEEGATSCWLRVSQAFAGMDHGTYFLPKVGDEVVVAFEDGDPDRPLVVGSVYNADHTFPLDVGQEERRSIFHTTEGFKVYVDDNESDQKLHVESPADKHDFVFMAGREIITEAQDNVSLKANKQINVESVEDITVKGDKPITMESMDNITIEGTGSGTITIKQGPGTITIDGGGNITLEGTRIEIKASADVTVQGAIIKLN